MKALSKDVIEVVKREFEPICGKPCWLVTYDRSSGVRINFGEPYLIIKELKETIKNSKRKITVFGQWSLMVRHCHWGFYLNDRGLAHDNSPIDVVNTILPMLDGQILVSVVVDTERECTEFCFELGDVLQTRSYDQYDKKYMDIDKPAYDWILYKPDQAAFSYRGDGIYKYGKGLK